MCAIERYLTRREAVELLQEHGYPISYSTLTKLSMPSRGEGPISEGCWGNWPAPGSEDTELGVLMELEVGHGETEVYAGVQA
jgi:hypothetical protein